MEKDLQINKLDLDLESLKTPAIYGKYLKYLNQAILTLKKLESDEKVMIREKWEYYSGKSDPDIYKEKPFDLKVLKSDVPMYIDSDSDMIVIRDKIAYARQIANYLTEVIKGISNRNWNIKNAIEWRKFTSGIA